VVGASPDQIYLIIAGGPVLRGVELPVIGMPGQALDVAMTVAIDRRSGEGVISRDGAVRVDAEDFSRQRTPVLCQTHLGSIAGGDVELAIRPEGETAAIVDRCSGDAVQNNGEAARSS